MASSFDRYLSQFLSLHTCKQRGFQAPHKPLLLMAVMDLVEQGVITSPIIKLSDALVESFGRQSRQYVGTTRLFKPNIGQPFFHMRSEPFWKLVPSLPIERPDSYSVSTLRQTFDYALIDTELFELFNDPDARECFRKALIVKYFKPLNNSTLTIGKQMLMFAPHFLCLVV